MMSAKLSCGLFLAVMPYIAIAPCCLAEKPIEPPFESNCSPSPDETLIPADSKSFSLPVLVYVNNEEGCPRWSRVGGQPVGHWPDPYYVQKTVKIPE